MKIEISIREFVAPDGGYLVTSTGEPGNLSAESTLDLAAIPADQIAAAIDAMDQGSLDADATVQFGRALFEALFVGDLAKLYTMARGHGPPAVRLIIEVPPAQRIPWELLHDGEHFLAVAGPMARGMASLTPAEPAIAELPLRILVVDAFPEGVDKLDSQLEAANIADALGPLASQGKAETEVLAAASLDGLQDALRSAAAEPDPRPFHVLHFIGHGVLDEAGEDDDDQPRTYLLFERAGTRQPHHVGPQDLVEIIGEYDLKLVFLNACQSVGTTAQEAAETFAPVLLGSGIPAVVGMQTSVFDDVAVAVSREFYEALADNTPVDRALTHARRIVKAAGPDEVAHAGVPVCYLRSDTGRILDLKAPVPRTPSGSRRFFTKVTDWVLSAIVGAVVLAGGAFIINWLQGPDRMNELSFNVAVAEFATAAGASSATATDLGTALFEQVAGALEELQFTDVWGPDQAGRISGDSREERAADAEELADRINADLVVYGVLRGTGRDGEFLPEFFVNDRQLPGASELTGAYVLGDGDPFDSTLDAVDELRDRLAGRANGLAQFVIGLSAYSRGSFDRALDRFEQAAAVPGWREEDGKEVLWLYLGNTHGRLRDYSSAGAAYETALGINPDYARAIVGQADIGFQLSRGNCFPPADSAGLELSASQFRQALAVSATSPRADIETKATYGLGRVLMCQQIGGIAADSPIPLFESVIQNHADGDEATRLRLRELAAEAHANLGIVYATIEPVDLSRAVGEYQAAIELTESGERQATFLGNQADAYRRSGDCPEAAAALDQALGLTQDATLRAQLTTQRDTLDC